MMISYRNSNKFLLVFFLLFATVVGIVRGDTAFAPRRGRAIATVPAPPRAGGAGGDPVIDSDLAGKLLTGAYLVQGALLQLAPAQQLDFYGMQGCENVCHALCSDFGSDVAATGIISYLALIEKTTANKAIGSAFLFLFVWTSITLAVDRQNSIGANSNPLFARLFLFGLGTYATLFASDKDEKDSISSKLVKFVAYFRLLYGTFTILFPDKVGDSWGLSLTDSAADHYLMRAIGFSITSISIVMVALLHGFEAEKAVGYGGIGTTAYFICQKFITKEWEKVGMPAGKNYAWMVFVAAMSAAIMSLLKSL